LAWPSWETARQTVGCGVLRGSARLGKAARIIVLAFYGVGNGKPVALALAFCPARLDFASMWIGILAAQLVSAVLMLHAVQRMDWPEQAVHASVLLTGSGGCVIAVTDVAMSKAGMQARPN
jgi:MATE family multidrug resistance protein